MDNKIKVEALDYYQEYQTKEECDDANRRLTELLRANPFLLEGLRHRYYKKEIIKHIFGNLILLRTSIVKFIIKDIKSESANKDAPNAHICSSSLFIDQTNSLTGNMWSEAYGYHIMPSITHTDVILRHKDINYVDKDFKGLDFSSDRFDNYIMIPYSEELWNGLVKIINLPTMSIKEFIKKEMELTNATVISNNKDVWHLKNLKVPMSSVIYYFIPVVSTEEIVDSNLYARFKTKKGKVYGVIVRTLDCDNSINHDANKTFFISYNNFKLTRE